jgi:hypothetical protein
MVELMEFRRRCLFRAPNDVISDSSQTAIGLPSGLHKRNKAEKVLVSEHLVKQCLHSMHILIANLHEDGAGIREEIAGNGEAVAEVGQVAVDTVAPSVAEGLDLLGLARVGVTKVMPL